MPVGTARHLAASERRRRGILPASRRRDEPVDELFEETARLLVRVYVEEVRRTVKHVERGELDRENFRQLRKLGKEVAGLVKALSSPDPTTSDLVAEAQGMIDGASLGPIERALRSIAARTSRCQTPGDLRALGPLRRAVCGPFAGKPCSGLEPETPSLPSTGRSLIGRIPNVDPSRGLTVAIAPRRRCPPGRPGSAGPASVTR
jgi:hypothetical protein